MKGQINLKQLNTLDKDYFYLSHTMQYCFCYVLVNFRSDITQWYVKDNDMKVNMTSVYSI